MSNIKSAPFSTATSSPLFLFSVAAIAASVLTRLVLDFTTLGSNDISYWFSFSQHVREHDSFSIYQIFPYYNHPPLMSQWLVLANKLSANTKEIFALVFRLIPIIADLAASYLVWILATTYLTPQRSLLITSLFACSPVLIMVSGFHGNTDPIFMFLILLALQQAICAGSALTAGLALGLAVNIKLVPLIMIPAFFFWLPTWRQRSIFCSSVALSLLAGFGYHLSKIPNEMYQNVFAYKGLTGIWGLSYLSPAYPSYGRWTLFGSITLVALLKGILANRYARGNSQIRSKLLLEAFALTFLCFFVFTPGFGIQYLSWFAAPVVFLSITGTLLYSIVGGIFMFRVYTYWSRGFPWYYADSDTMGPWVGPEISWALLTYSVIILIFINELRKLIINRGGLRSDYAQIS